MHVSFIDRSGAHSIWRLMDAISQLVLDFGGEVSYVRMWDPSQRPALAVPTGVRVHDISVVRKRSPLSVIRQQQQFCAGLRKFLQRNPIDVVHTNFGIPGYAARKVAKQEFGLSVVSTCHELYGSMNSYLRRKARGTNRYADKIVYISAAVAASYGARLSVDESVIEDRELIIYNGVDVEAITAIAAAVRSHQTNGIVSVGRLVAEKGHAQVIRALPRLANAFTDLKYRLVGDGPERAALAALAEQLGVASRVEFQGWLPYEQAIRQMANARVVAMPSRPVQEGFGLALAEAICCGRSVVASDIPVFREVAGRASDVTLFRDGDLDSLTACLDAALRRDLSADESINCRKIDDRFSDQYMATEYCRLYRKLTSRNSGLDPR